MISLVKTPTLKFIFRVGNKCLLERLLNHKDEPECVSNIELSLEESMKSALFGNQVVVGA